MRVTYRISEEVELAPESYLHHLSKSLRELIFDKYLNKITAYGLCTSINSIKILNNTLLRNSANLLLQILLELEILKL